MSSRSSSSESCKPLAHLGDLDALPAPPGLNQDARERDEPSEALRADRRVGLRIALGRGRSASRARSGGAPGGRLWAPRPPGRCRPARASRRGSSSSRARRRPCSSHQLRRAEQARILAEAEHPGDDHARAGVARAQDPVSVAVAFLAGAHHLAVATEVALDLPGDPLAQEHLGDPLLLAELPLGAIRVLARVEIGRAPEVVLGLGRVGDLAADAREPEDPDLLALMGVTEQIELAALEEQVVGVHPARAHLVAGHRVVVEGDRLVAEDRRLDLRQAHRQLMTAGRGGDRRGDRAAARARAAGWDAPR